MSASEKRGLPEQGKASTEINPMQAFSWVGPLIILGLAITLMIQAL